MPDLINLQYYSESMKIISQFISFYQQWDWLRQGLLLSKPPNNKHWSIYVPKLVKCRDWSKYLYTKPHDLPFVCVDPTAQGTTANILYNNQNLVSYYQALS